jgi:hypothetical protein
VNILGAQKENNMQKWSYCLLYYYEKLSGSKFSKRVSGEGILKLKIHDDKNTVKEYGPEQLSELIAWLGNNGWELVNVTALEYFAEATGSIHSKETYYFKKPIDN